METLNEFSNVIIEPAKSLVELKRRTGKRLLACIPMHIPEELVHAAGMIPVIPWESDEPITLAHAHVQPATCGYCRSIIDVGFKGKLDFIDGWIFSDCCLAPRAMAYFVGRYMNPAYLQTIYLPVPLKQAHSREFLTAELERLKASLEKFAGHNITEESLEKSIRVYNRNRAMLRRVYDIRRNRPGLLRAKDVLSIVMSSMLMPKEEHNELLEGLLVELENKMPADDHKVRLVLSGALCQAPRVDMLDAVDEAGAGIVDDDLYVGSRYIITDAPDGVAPMESLASRFLNMRRCCPTKSDLENDWGEQLVAIVKGSKAQGVISLQVKFCEAHYYYYPDVVRALTSAGIPELKLEMEHEVMGKGLGQVRTRIQAFVESIAGVGG